MRRSKQSKDKAGLRQMRLLTGWHLIPARDEDEMLRCFLLVRAGAVWH